MNTGHELAMALRVAYLTLHRRTGAALHGDGVTADQFVVLHALAGSDAATQSELVERTTSDPNTLRAMLLILERRGLVERRPNPSDGRARLVMLTDLGRRTHRGLWRRSEALRVEMVEALSEPDALRLLELLRRFGEALETPRRAPSAPGRTRARPSMDQK